jgi:hypothetical protein
VDGPRTVALIQAFGGPVSTGGGETQSVVRVNGQPAMLSLHKPTGEMVITWSLQDDELAMVASLDAFSQEELIALAESVRLPGAASNLGDPPGRTRE